MPRSNVVPLNVAPVSTAANTIRVVLVAISADGRLRVRDDEGKEFECDWLETGASLVLEPGDRLAALAPDASGRGLALGRIGAYRAPGTQACVTIEATEVLTLRCGDAVLDLRADGKAVLKGEDVLIRAKGLQRIKAGSVSIN